MGESSVTTGVGLDIVDLLRIEAAVARHGPRFAARVLSAAEFNCFSKMVNPKRAIEWLAGRFAVKEATVKALGTGFGGQIGMRDIETQSLEGGSPSVRILPTARFILPSETRLFVSISHTHNTAVAVVIAERGAPVSA